jgi:hypothetical protein
MTAWRVTYLPAPTMETRRPFAVTVEDPDSPSLETFVSRLSGGALGVEWTQGRVIRSVEAFERYENRRRRLFLTALLTGLVAASVVTGLVLVGVVPSGAPYRHSWSGTLYTGAASEAGCFSQPLVENFPNGSQISGTWTAPQAAVIFIQTTNGTICPGGTQSTPNECTEPGVTSGAFEFTFAGGSLSFEAGSQNPENVSVSGDWST